MGTPAALAACALARAQELRRARSDRAADERRRHARGVVKGAAPRRLAACADLARARHWRCGAARVCSALRRCAVVVLPGCDHVARTRARDGPLALRASRGHASQGAYRHQRGGARHAAPLPEQQLPPCASRSAGPAVVPSASRVSPAPGGLPPQVWRLRDRRLCHAAAALCLAHDGCTRASLLRPSTPNSDIGRSASGNSARATATKAG